MKASVYSLKGKKLQKKVELPKVFEGDVRPDIIKRAVLASQSARLQPYGPNPMSGKRTSAGSWGVGRGLARLPRVSGGGPTRGRGAFAPMAVGGRVAHPARPERHLIKKINKKEMKKAVASAIAATADKDLVLKRGHRIGDVDLPIIIQESLEKIDVTQETKEVLEALGLKDEIERGKKRKIRAGKGKRRGRKYKNRKGMLIVVSDDKGITLGARNLPAVEVVTVDELGVEHLAPGTHYGRLTIYTNSALDKIKERFDR
ncbi:MAG: 50S ribosomal protein L4 [Candidatus Hydrothermarchaeales archaeon]